MSRIPYNPPYRSKVNLEPGERFPSAILFAREYATETTHHNGAEQFFPEVQRVSSDGKQYRCLPLLEVSMTVNVYHTISRSLLKQTFYNGSSIVIAEATYSFSLYDGSTVVGFNCEIGNERLLEGLVKPTGEAQRIYKKEIAENRTAALLQEHTPEVFEVCLGNIPPNTSVSVEMVYLNELKVEIGGQGLMLTIPTSVAPRYGSSPLESSANALSGDNSGLEIVVDIHTLIRLRRIESTTHPTSVETDLDTGPIIAQTFDALTIGDDAPKQYTRRSRAKLSDSNTVLGKDFVLIIFASDNSPLRSQAVLEPSATLNADAALMVSIFPQDLFASEPANEAFDGEILLLADRSGSMGPKMDSLRKAMKLFLQSLPQGCRFNIASFGSKSSSLWSKQRR